MSCDCYEGTKVSSNSSMHTSSGFLALSDTSELMFIQPILESVMGSYEILRSWS